MSLTRKFHWNTLHILNNLLQSIIFPLDELFIFKYPLHYELKSVATEKMALFPEIDPTVTAILQHKSFPWLSVIKLWSKSHRVGLWSLWRNKTTIVSEECDLLSLIQSYFSLTLKCDTHKYIEYGPWNHMHTNISLHPHVMKERGNTQKRQRKKRMCHRGRLSYGTAQNFSKV